MSHGNCGCQRCAQGAEFDPPPVESNEWEGLEAVDPLSEARRPSLPRPHPPRRIDPGGAPVAGSSSIPDGFNCDAALILDGFTRADYRLNPRHLESLRALAIRLKNAPPGPVAALQIRGHTDNSGGADMNSALGFARALEVQSFLAGAFTKLNLAIASHCSSGSEREPVASNATEAGRIRNRRVEVRVCKTSISGTPSVPAYQEPSPVHVQPEPSTYLPLPTIPLPWLVPPARRPRPVPSKRRIPRRRVLARR